MKGAEACLCAALHCCIIKLSAWLAAQKQRVEVSVVLIT